MKDLSNEERPKLGALANEFRDEITGLLESKSLRLKPLSLPKSLKMKRLM
jgi:phenylalanyl-tRNA synthetase alpha chain